MHNVSLSRSHSTLALTVGLLVTGCIRPSHLSRLNPNDAGGQYDSSGGAGGKGNPQGSQCLGNPQGSQCLGYKHYVELVEPAGPRACIKCCDDPADCPTNQGMYHFLIRAASSR